MNKALNFNIRSEISSYISLHGRANTRFLIATLSKKYHTTKQRVSGNLSAMVRYFGYNIASNPPHSVIY